MNITLVKNAGDTLRVETLRDEFLITLTLRVKYDRVIVISSVQFPDLYIETGNGDRTILFNNYTAEALHPEGVIEAMGAMLYGALALVERRREEAEGAEEEHGTESE